MVWNNGKRVEAGQEPGLDPGRDSAVAERALSGGAKALLVALSVLAIFGVVLVASLAVGNKAPKEGSELLAAPSPLLPGSLAGGYSITPQPDIAAALESDYRSRSLSIVGVEAASIGLRGSVASVFAASLPPGKSTASSQFRAGVLTGAAGGFGIDPAKNPFRASFQGGLVVYSTSAESGRLFVWFFEDAFVQAFVPAAIASEADEIRRVVIDAQLAGASRR